MSQTATLKGIVMWTFLWCVCVQFSAVQAAEVAAATPGRSIGRMKTVSTPKPPFPAWIIHRVPGTRPVRYLVVAVIAVDRGRIRQVTSICDNVALGNYTADWIKQRWLFTPEASGTFKLPIYFSD